VQVGLPKGIQSHLIPVRDLLNWLQVREFINLVLLCAFHVYGISVCRRSLNFLISWVRFNP